jgi:hypothetical protein
MRTVAVCMSVNVTTEATRLALLLFTIYIREPNSTTLHSFIKRLIL